MVGGRTKRERERKEREISLITKSALHRKLFFMSFEMGEVTVWNRYCDTMIST